MKKLAPFLLLLTVLAGTVVFPGIARADDNPQISAEAAVVMDAATGAIVYGKHLHQRMYPASLTKILTALVLLKRTNLTDWMVTSPYAASQEPDSLFLKAGQKISVADALHALLMISANDVAVVAAEHVAGSVQNFARLMNREAASIGAEESHFVNPNGLFDPDHYSSAYDLALITRAAIQDPEFRAVIHTKYYTVHVPVNETLRNQNRLLFEDNEIIGGKPGYTDEAGNCLMEVARQGNTTLIAIVLHSPGLVHEYGDMQALLDYGFAHARTVRLAAKGEALGTFSVPDETAGFEYVAPQDVFATVSPQGPLNISKSFSPMPVKAPVRLGQPVGTVTFLVNGQSIRTPVVAGQPVTIPLYARMVHWFQGLGPFVLLLLAILLLRRRRVNRRTRSKAAASWDRRW
jgi:D-alanyl-D-alanine carboxypeptidase (penicillin-binding protein 5/6)